MKLAYIFLLSFLLMGIACKDPVKSADAKKTEAVAKPVPPRPDKPAKVYPGIDAAILSKLYAESDFTDYIFFDLPFSLSQKDQASVRSSLANIGPEPQGTIPPGCKPIARQMFHIGAEIVSEFDVYYSEGCTFYALMENEKPVALNKTTVSGQNFYKSIIEQAMHTRQDMQK